jgi:replicative DNA helicase
MLDRYKLGQDPARFVERVRRKVSGLQTGIDSLDRQLLGLSGLVGLLGSPGTFKSTLAQQIAAKTALDGCPVFYLDRENGRDRIERRVLCNLLGVSMDSLKAMPTTKLAEYDRKLSKLPLYICNEFLPFDEFRKRIDCMMETYPDKRGLIIIDSLQSLLGKEEEKRIVIDRWLTELDQTKLDYEDRLTIVVVSEKKRGTYDAAAKDGGKESGTIEYKVEQQLDLRLDNENIILECTKDRDGPCDVNVTLQKALQHKDNNRSFIYRLSEVESF